MSVLRTATIAALAVATTGGIALAAASGGKPSAPGRALPSNAAGQAQAHAGRALGAHSPHASKTETESGADTPEGSPSPNLNGLCRAWLSGGGRHGKSPAFAALKTAADGVGSVTDFCIARVGEHTGRGHGDEPGEESGEPAEPSDEAGPSHGSHGKSGKHGGPDRPVPSHRHH